MVETWICPELGTNFTENFSVMLINHIYNNWSYTTLTGDLAGLNKPPVPSGQSNTIDFRAGIKDDFKTLQVTALQGRTLVVEHLQVGYKSELMTTQILVRANAKIIGRDDVTDYLRYMNQEIGSICGRYKQVNQTGNMAGIKDLIYEGNEYEYMPNDKSDKSDWGTIHSILMFYELRDISS